MLQINTLLKRELCIVTNYNPIVRGNILPLLATVALKGSAHERVLRGLVAC